MSDGIVVDSIAANSDILFEAVVNREDHTRKFRSAFSSHRHRLIHLSNSGLSGDPLVAHLRQLSEAAASSRGSVTI